MTVPWPFLLLLARGVALISTVSPLLMVSSPLLGLLDYDGRRASRAARRVQVSENSFNRSDIFARSFVPHRRVISRDSDLRALGVSISSSSGLARVSVSRVSGELSASCSLCGRALVCESGAHTVMKPLEKQRC